jgi:hypothetical protein
MRRGEAYWEKFLSYCLKDGRSGKIKKGKIRNDKER